MNKKCGMLSVFSLYLFLLLSSQHAHAHGALGITAVINPVADMLGVTATAVVDIVHNAYQGYLEKNKKEEGCCFPGRPDEVVLAERFYYEQRKEALEKTKQELVGIKKDLETLKGLNPDSFTYQFLKQYSYPEVHSVQLPSISQEKCFSEDEKNGLKNVRANELISLEKQINAIQNLLVLHLNQLVENLSWVESLYQNAMVEITKVMDVWNNNSHVITPDVASKIYENYLFREHLITRVHSVFDELLVISRYYRVCKNESIKLIATNIAILEQMVSVVEAKKSWLLEEERQARNGTTILERYFANRNISVSTLKSGTQKEVSEAFKKHSADALKKLAIQQQTNSGFGGGPRKDDDKDNEEKIEISEEDKDHIFRESEGHFVKDTPQARKIIEDIVADKNNYNGLDKYGTKWYSKITSDGQQVWAGVRNNKIRYAGINKVPWPKDITTGLLIRSTSNLKI